VGAGKKAVRVLLAEEVETLKEIAFLRFASISRATL